jgi:HEAT repeat protein
VGATLLLVLSMVVGSSRQAADWKEVEAEFKKAWSSPSPGGDAAARASALERLFDWHDARIVPLCVAALETSEKRLESLTKDAAALEAAWLPLQKAELSKDEWARHDALDARRKEVAALAVTEGEIEDSVVRLLATREGDAVAAALSREGGKNASWRIRALSFRAISAFDSGAAVEALVKGLSDSDARVRVAAADGLREREAPTSVDALVLALAKEKEWPVKVAIAAAFARLRNAKSVGPLVSALAREEGRVREEIAAALAAITGEKFGVDPRAWRDWFNKQAEEADTILAPFPPQTSLVPSHGVTFQGIETRSRGIVFVLDISDSMNDAAGETELPADWSTPDRSGKKRSKIDVMRDELVTAIKTLDEKASFNVILYNHQVKSWQPGKLVAANSSNKNLALSFLLKEPASGGTNIFDAIEKAFTLAGLGATDKNYKSAVDTIFLVSDGAPSAGRILEPGKIIEEVARMNALRKVKIHTVGVGVLHDRAFLERLARDSGGKYVARL